MIIEKMRGTLAKHHYDINVDPFFGKETVFAARHKYKSEPTIGIFPSIPGNVSHLWRISLSRS
jgi:hypothetical protein